MWWSGVFRAPAGVQWQAAKEVIVVGVVGIAPLLLSVILAPTDGLGFGEAASRFLLQGQLFLYAMSFCGSVLWYSSLDGTDGKPFPPRVWFILFCFLCAAFTYGVLGSDPAQAEPKPAYLNWISVFFFLAALFFYWVILVMRTMPPPSIESTNASQTADLLVRFNQLKGGVDE